MSRNKGHIPKTSQERANYVSYIKKLDYEPTKDEALNFSESSDNDPDYSIQKSNKISRLTTWEQFQIHFEENWIRWVIAGVAIVITYFVVSSQVSFNGIDIRIEQTGKDIEKINSNIETIQKSNHQQDMKIQKNEILIENIKNNQKQKEE